MMISEVCDNVVNDAYWYRRHDGPLLAPVRWAAGFGVTVSDGWAFFSALMPESDNFKVRPLYTVVHEVPYAGKVETANVLVPGVLDWCADAGLSICRSARGLMRTTSAKLSRTC